MRALVIEPFPTARGIIPAGRIIEIPPALLEKLQGKVTPLSQPEAWLTETGELRTRGVVPDLAAAIVGLTSDNLPLQRELLTRHCEAYDRHHIEHLWAQWAERAAIMECDGGLSRHEAEYRAAERLHLLAFLEDRAAARSGNRGG